MKINRMILIVGASILFLFSCLLPPFEKEDLTIMTWNVQNLFDGESSGLEYGEFDPEKSDWSQKLVDKRLSNLSQVIYEVDRKGPDIILFQEVENKGVLDYLNREFLHDLYAFSGAWDIKGGAIRCGILSKYPPRYIHEIHPPQVSGYPLRAITELHFVINQEDLILFNNHWKSRIGGVAATESKRLSSAKALSQRIHELEEEGLDFYIIAGDLNGSALDYRKGGQQCSQIPIGEYYNLNWTDSFYVSSNPKDLQQNPEKLIVFSPWKSFHSKGSYVYQKRWLPLDHFLMGKGLFDGQGWEFAKAQLLTPPFMIDTEGFPFKWETWMEEGYSDHFPLLLTLSVGHTP